MKFSSLRATALVGLLTAAAFPALADDPVVATVNGKDIHRSVIVKAKESLGQHGMVPLDKIYDRLLDQAIDEQLVLDQAMKQNVEKDPRFKTEMEDARRQVLMHVYLAKRADADIPESAIKQGYDEMTAKMPAKEEVKVRHILVATEDEAKAVIADLQSGVSFEDEAKAKSLDPAAKTNGGEAGYISKDKAVPEFSAAAFKLTPGEYTKVPVKSEFGWHIIKAEDRRTVPPPSYEDAKSQIKEALVQQDVQKIIADLHSNAKIARFKADGTPASDKPKN